MQAIQDHLEGQLQQSRPSKSNKDRQRTMTKLEVTRRWLDHQAFCWDDCTESGSGADDGLSACAASPTVVYMCEGCTRTNHTCPVAFSCSGDCVTLEPPPPPPPLPPPPYPPAAPPPPPPVVWVAPVLGSLGLALVIFCSLGAWLYGRRLERRAKVAEDPNSRGIQLPPAGVPPQPRAQIRPRPGEDTDSEDDESEEISTSGGASFIVPRAV